MRSQHTCISCLLLNGICAWRCFICRLNFSWIRTAFDGFHLPDAKLYLVLVCLYIFRRFRSLENKGRFALVGFCGICCLFFFVILTNLLETDCVQCKTLARGTKLLLSYCRPSKVGLFEKKIIKGCWIGVSSLFFLTTKITSDFSSSFRPLGQSSSNDRCLLSSIGHRNRRLPIIFRDSVLNFPADKSWRRSTWTVRSWPRSRRLGFWKYSSFYLISSFRSKLRR